MQFVSLNISSLDCEYQISGMLGKYVNMMPKKARNIVNLSIKGITKSVKRFLFNDSLKILVFNEIYCEKIKIDILLASGCMKNRSRTPANIFVSRTPWTFGSMHDLKDL